MPYRIPIFELLGKQYNLTVAFSLGDGKKNFTNFTAVKLPIRKYSRFVVHKVNLVKFCQDFDFVIGMSDLSWLSIMGLGLSKKKDFKLIYWGIGVRASYDTNFGEITFWDKLRYFIFKRADALLFYSNFPIARYLEQGFPKEKLFVANNTVEVISQCVHKGKSTILFIGTLYKQKRIYNLLENYLKAYSINENLPNLVIIGGGAEFENIKKWISQNLLSGKVILTGKIFDETILCEYFSNAIACISPGQAGLSVLKSMGYGVPFISQKSAVTGGEILNIENNVTGLLYNDHSELKDIILEISLNPDKFINMGLRAKLFYDNNRKPIHMVSDICRAIEYTDMLDSNTKI